jgi:hypothetical protein
VKARKEAPDSVDMPTAREDVVFRPLAREWVLYDPISRQLHVLNVTAALVWSHCDGAHDLPALVDAVRANVEDAPEAPIVEAHVLDALGTFAKEGLLR